MLRDTHESTSDPEARLYKKSTVGEAKPSYLGHVLMENRHGLVVQACVTQSGRKAERDAAEEMVTPLASKRNKQSEAKTATGPLTLGADKSYQTEAFIQKMRELQVVPHVAEYEKETSLSKNWLTRNEREDPGFAISQEKRKLVEKIFGWMKSVAGMRKTKLRGQRRVDWAFRLCAAASNLLRLVKLMPMPA